MQRNHWLAHEKYGHVTTSMFDVETHDRIVKYLGTTQRGFRGRTEQILVYWTWPGLVLAHLMSRFSKEHRGKRVVWWVDIQV